MAAPQRLPSSIDIMNDPAYAPKKSTSAGSSETDHCRICRSEGTPEEPLFHPCKCSGSIKFVHQDCLMEWLQHSQKKYCELCKTPFRFTKLYDPTMPKNLPLPLFLSRASRHLGRTLLVWLRFLLVCFVWLGILPWSVRWMWRFWFWFGDFGWIWWKKSPRFHQNQIVQNSTAAERPANLSSINETVTVSELREEVTVQWGSGISFVNLTRSGLLNKIILDTFEGQILTALIIVTFVMIFLIREWVVQQQPNLAIVEDNIPQAEAAANIGPNLEVEDNDDEEDEEDDSLGTTNEMFNIAYERLEAGNDDDGNDMPRHQQEAAPQPRRFAPLRRRRAFGTPDPNEQPNATESNALEAGPSSTGPSSALTSGFQTEAGHPRRPLANREIMAQAAELQRRMEERASGSNSLPEQESSNLRNAILEENSEWEDEEEEGGEGLKITKSSRRGYIKGKASTQPEDHSQSQVSFQWPPKSSEPDLFSNNATLPPGTAEPVIFGQSIPSHFFGEWDTGKRPLFAESSSILDEAAQSNNSSNAIPESPLPTRLFRNEIDNQSETPSPVVSPVVPDKGKRKEGISDDEMDEFAWDEETMDPEYLSDDASIQLGISDDEGAVNDEDQDENLGPDSAMQLTENDMNNLIPDGGEHQTVGPQLPLNEDPNAEVGPPIQARPDRRRPRGNRLFDWIVGDIPQDQGEGVRAGEGAQREADPAAPGNMNRENNNGAVEGAVAAVDVDDADDFDGIMELIGMRGPIWGLVQNASICVVLITAAIILGVAIPYMWGRLFFGVLANPLYYTVAIPWATAMFCANLAIDSIIYVSCTSLYEIDYLVRFIFGAMGLLIAPLTPLGKSTRMSNILYTCASGGWQRILDNLMQMFLTFGHDKAMTTIDGFPIEASSRQPWARATLAVSWFTEKLAASVNITSNASQHLLELAQKNKTTSEAVHAAIEKLVDIWSQPSSKQLNATIADPTVSETGAVFVELSSAPPWTAADRVIFVLAGYALFTIAGAWYLSKCKSQPGTYRRHLEKASIEILQQAGGVMKVILIIGIEMFVFPLYCGVLLDVALLPLFENASILSRVQFTVDHLFTSTFVHWFVGTCYMFHFALFVSMCRKIMRPGVLYFIRDPDDPNLHPVKDVLERPVMLQLRKIAFSAFIYGFLVLVCLGGVVWWLYHAFENVLPIHWSSNEPVLEFPVDLLFYNFFMPVAVQFFKPSEGLQKMYSWWFRQCARAFRLTSFMFGDRRSDEEGHVVRNTWAARFLLKGSDPSDPVVAEKADPAVTKRETYFLRDGRYVRAPASDSVRRPKGEPVFIPVNENNQRTDSQPDPEDGESGPNSSDFRLVYIPPRFKTRITLVVISIWLFAAVTGVSVTIGPLLVGRKVLRSILPEERRMNDVYAFSIGIYIFGGLGYLFTNTASIKDWLRSITHKLTSPQKVGQAMTSYFFRAIKLLYIFLAFVIILPTLFALMIEFYLIIPTHTYFFSDEAHVIHFVQDWTLGILYMKMLGNMLLLDADSPWARALRGVVARGYFDPDVKLATRCFILPATVLMLVSLLIPLGLGYLASKTLLREAEPAIVAQAYRYSYPAVFVLIILMIIGYFLKRVVDRWKQSVRDEVYLIGEKLHNHGERRSAQPETLVAETSLGTEANEGSIGEADRPLIAPQQIPA